MTKWVYSFGSGCNEGNAGPRDLLGGKGANLTGMAGIGPVPVQPKRLARRRRSHRSIEETSAAVTELGELWQSRRHRNPAQPD